MLGRCDAAALSLGDVHSGAHKWPNQLQYLCVLHQIPSISSLPANAYGQLLCVFFISGFICSNGNHCFTFQFAVSAQRFIISLWNEMQKIVNVYYEYDWRTRSNRFKPLKHPSKCPWLCVLILASWWPQNGTWSSFIGLI